VTTRPPRAAYLAWLSVCVVWGTTYLAIRVALESIPPALVGGLRFTVAGVVLALVLRLRGHPLPPRDQWLGLAVLGTLMLAVGNGFVVWAEQWVPSGIAAVVIASSPFWMATTEALIPGGERFSSRTLLGMSIGFSGILLLVWPDLTAGGSWGRQFAAGLIALQLAEIGWSLGSSYSKRRTQQHNALTASAVQMFFGGLVMLAAATVRGEWPLLAFTPRSLAAELYLIVFGSFAGYSAYIYALKHLPVSTVSLYAYVNPLIAVALGALILDEALDARIAVASILVLIGIGVVRTKRTTTEPGARNREGDALPSSRSGLQPSHHSAAADQPYQEQHDGDDQQDPDEIPERVAADHPEQPQDDQNDRNRLEHASSPPPGRHRAAVREDGVQLECRAPRLR
jgi:drug/metabolite transporter (DMT)-like permease